MKIKIKNKELYDWFKNLQQEMLTQGNDNTREPTYWCICYRKKKWMEDPEYADGWETGENGERYYYSYEQFYPAENQFFLTRKDCLEHIKRLKYRYPDGHTYCLSGVENKEFTNLVKVIKEMEFE